MLWQVLTLILWAGWVAQSAEPLGTREDYRAFALGRVGDVTRGKALFSDPRTGCDRCHSVDGSSSKAGPDLSGIGDKFTRPDLIRSILEPSATIAVGYGTTLIETQDGAEIQGVVKQVTGEWTEVVDGAGQRLRIPNKRIREQRVSPISLMPEGLEAGLTPAEFNDLVGYLASLHLAPGAVAELRGSPATIARAAREVAFEPLFKGPVKFEHPVWCGQVPGRPDRFVVLEHGGRAWMIQRGGAEDAARVFLDLRSQVRVGGATGLLGLAFHPRFAENRRYFLKYQILDHGKIQNLLVERRFAEDFLNDAGGDPRELLRIEAVTQDHNGGCIEFGPDGFLYLGMGDTGPQRDPQGHGQDLGLLLGKIVRLDVDHQDVGKAYAIPRDNPFRDQPGVRPEIWAYGFREPWRFSFDPLTQDLWVGDVGQDRVEEVGIVRRGENHGWNVFEGFEAFSTAFRRTNAVYVPPVFAYPHRVGVSVTGGHVYRGTAVPTLNGWYLCADFESRRVWALTQTNRVLDRLLEIGRAPSRVVSFVRFADGELGVVGYDSGLVYRLDLRQVDLTALSTRVLASTAESGAVRWRYTASAPSATWFSEGFDDRAWLEASGGFGTPGTPGAIVGTLWQSADIWIRREFDLATTPSVAGLRLRVHHDEDAEIYLNGVEAARLPRWTSGYVEVPISAEAAATLRTGKNVLAVHCHQNSGGQFIDVGLVEYFKPTGP